MSKNLDITSKYKTIIGKISKSSLRINDDIEWKKDENGEITGWICFSINLKELNLTKEDISENFGKELFSHFMIDFIGELLIRSNVKKFMTEIMKLNSKQFNERHKRFGMTFNAGKEKIEFYFHISLLQNTFTEDFKLHINYI